MDVRGVNVGGKGSTQFVVQGSQKEFPRELLEELKVICQVRRNIGLSEYFVNLYRGKTDFQILSAGSNLMINYI